MGERISFVGMCFVTVTEAYSLRRVLNVVVYHFYVPPEPPTTTAKQISMYRHLFHSFP